MRRESVGSVASGAPRPKKEKKKKIDDALEEITTLFAVKFHGFDEGVYSSETPDELPKEYIPYISSFGESKSEKLAEQDGAAWIEHNLRNFSRIYPKGTRVESTNYSPLPMWQSGAHMVALNYQTMDLNMQLNNGLFRLNSCCGYALKPKWMRELRPLPDESRLKPPLPPIPRPMQIPQKLRIVRITIESARFLPKADEDRKMPEPWLQVDRYGRNGEPRCPLRRRGAYVPSDKAVVSPVVRVSVHGGRLAGAGEDLGDVVNGRVYTSRKVVENGLRPRWHDECVVVSSHPEIAMVHFEVRSKMQYSEKTLAYEVVPLVGLQEGHRVLPLRDRHGARVQFAQLHLNVRKARIGTPDRLAPVNAMLRTLGLADAEPQFEVAFADIDALVKRHAENQLEEWLRKPRAEGGGGLSDEQMIKFIRALPTWHAKATNDTFDDTAKVGAAAAAEESKAEETDVSIFAESLHTEHRAPKTAGGL